jgi:hypothetical protein
MTGKETGNYQHPPIHYVPRPSPGIHGVTGLFSEPLFAIEMQLEYPLVNLERKVQVKNLKRDRLQLHDELRRILYTRCITHSPVSKGIQEQQGLNSKELMEVAWCGH